MRAPKLFVPDWTFRCARESYISIAIFHKKSPANAKGLRATAVHVWKHRQSPEGARWPAANYIQQRAWPVSLCQRCIGWKSQFFPTFFIFLFSAFVRGWSPSNLWKSFTVPETKSLSDSRRWRFGDPSLHRFWLIHPCDGQTDGQTKFRWLRRATVVVAVARKNRKLQNWSLWNKLISLYNVIRNRSDAIEEQCAFRLKFGFRRHPWKYQAIVTDVIVPWSARLLCPSVTPLHSAAKATAGLDDMPCDSSDPKLHRSPLTRGK